MIRALIERLRLAVLAWHINALLDRELELRARAGGLYRCCRYDDAQSLRERATNVAEKRRRLRKMVEQIQLGRA